MTPRGRGWSLPVLYEDPDEDHSWEVEGACRGEDQRLWFPSISDGRYPGGERAWERPETTAAARAICAVCPVRQDCLAAALRRNEPVGVWGGLDTKERRAIQRRYVA